MRRLTTEKWKNPYFIRFMFFGFSFSAFFFVIFQLTNLCHQIRLCNNGLKALLSVFISLFSTMAESTFIPFFPCTFVLRVVVDIIVASPPTAAI